jgi:hypothetical protein
MKLIASINSLRTVLREKKSENRKWLNQKMVTSESAPQKLSKE